MLTVFTVTDAADGTLAALAGGLSLREALEAANTDTSVDGSPVGNGADTIQLAAGLGPINLNNGELTIDESVTITRLGATTITINGGGASRIFNITNNTGDVAINGLTLTGGNPGAGQSGGAISSVAFGTLSVTDSDITGNAAQSGGGIYTYGDLALTRTIVGGAGALANTAVAGGGGIFLYDNAATLTIKNSTISGNTAGAGANGGGIFSYGNVSLDNSMVGGTAAGTGNTANNSGGGIYSTGVVDLLNTTVASNAATIGSGGGIFSTRNVTLRFSTVSGNAADDAGGGIYSAQNVSVQNSTVGVSAAGAGNIADDDGGGIYANNATVINSTISGNEATGNSGTFDGYGGGIFAINKVTLRNSTVSGNRAEDNGGGVFAFNALLQNATVANNIADFGAGGTGIGGGIYASTVFSMQNSIVAGNTDNGNGNPDLSVPGGSNVRFSLIGDNTGAVGVGGAPAAPQGTPNATGNIIGTGVDPITLAEAFGAGGGALASNGGPTQTIELKAPGFAVDKGKNTLVVNPAQGDQRGLPFVRIFGGRVDMGAFESQPPVPGNTAPIVANPIADQNAIVDTPYVFTFPANTFTDADGDPLAYTAALAGGGALPAWLTFNAAARTFIGVPTAADLGPITIRVTASDGKGGLIFDDFILTVVSNPPPTVVNPIPDQNATVTVPFNFTFAANTFTDPNGDVLTYSATLSGGGALPAWLTFNPATRNFSGTPAAGDVGTISVRVTADDGNGNTVFDDFNLTVSTSELPFNENFEGAADARIVEKSPAFAVTNTNPINGTGSFEATRPTVGSRPVATVDFALPATAGSVTNVSVNVSTGGGNGSTLWNNAVVIFDYQSPTNYKFAGVFEIIDRLIIGQVVNGRVQYLSQRTFAAAPNTSIPLNVAINRATRQVTLSSGATSFSHTYGTLGTGTVGLGTINANAKFDMLAIT